MNDDQLLYTFSSKFSINLDYDQSVETDKNCLPYPLITVASSF